MSNQSENTENKNENTTETESEGIGCFGKSIILFVLGCAVYSMCWNGRDDNKVEFRPTGDARRDSIEKIRVDLVNREFSNSELDKLMKMSRPVVYRRLAGINRRLTDFPSYWPAWSGSSRTTAVSRKGNAFICRVLIRYPITYVEIGVGAEMDIDVSVAFDHNTDTGTWSLEGIHFIEE